MKKIFIVISLFSMLFILTGCETGKIYTYQPITGIEAENAVPSVIISSSAGSDNTKLAKGTYTIFAPKYGALCSGEAYASKQVATANPLQIYSAGHEINVVVTTEYSDKELKSLQTPENPTNTVTIVMNSGEAKLINEDSNLGGYLYVIVI